jgi:hypothetical protein
LELLKGAQSTMLRLDSEYWVDTSNGLHAEVKSLLGPNSVADA